MKQYWTNLARTGIPDSLAEPGSRRFDGTSQHLLSLMQPRPQAHISFAAEHHCAFWALAS
jgi:hypothetical protein